MNNYKPLVFLAFLFVTASLFAQSRETRNPGSFDRISASEAIDVYLVPGNEEKVEVEVKGADLDDVVTDVSGGTLEIEMRRGNYDNVRVKVTVTYKSLREVEVSSAASIFSRGTVKSDQFEIHASSAGDIELDIETNELEISVSSAADVELEGKCNRAEISVSSAGDFDGRELNCKIVDIKVSSGGDATISVEEEINARASSGGSIKYYGDPQKERTSETSGGDVYKS